MLSCLSGEIQIKTTPEREDKLILFYDMFIRSTSKVMLFYVFNIFYHKLGDSVSKSRGIFWL